MKASLLPLLGMLMTALLLSACGSATAPCSEREAWPTWTQSTAGTGGALLAQADECGRMTWAAVHVNADGILLIHRATGAEPGATVTAEFALMGQCPQATATLSLTGGESSLVDVYPGIYGRTYPLHTMVQKSMGEVGAGFRAQGVACDLSMTATVIVN